ncbi:MAG: hypothetical protein WBD51_01100 [Burkholderiaceae bacterium]
MQTSWQASTQTNDQTQARSARLSRWLCVAAMGALLVACGDPHHNSRENSRTGSDRTNNGGETQPGRNNQACVYQLTGTISNPSRLENTNAACDYQLIGTVRVQSDLIVSPGVTVRAEPDAILIIDGGQIDARGTANQPITFTSMPGADQIWGGLRIENGLRSQFDYVDIHNVASTCSANDCVRGALIVDTASVSFTNSTIVGSTSNGFVLQGNGRIDRFFGNQFIGNQGAPVVLPGHAVHELDTASNYRGGSQPNTDAFILVTTGEQTANLTLRWKKLSVPYRIDSNYRVSDGTLLLEPGVQVEFSRDGYLEIQDNGALEAAGTTNSLVTLRGVRNEAGYWRGLMLTNSPWRENSLRYTDILNAGADVNGVAATIHLDNAAIALRNTVMANNSGVGIACDAPGSNEPASITSIDSDSLISGGIGDNCQVLD